MSTNKNLRDLARELCDVTVQFELTDDLAQWEDEGEVRTKLEQEADTLSDRQADLFKEIAACRAASDEDRRAKAVGFLIESVTMSEVSEIGLTMARNILGIGHDEAIGDSEDAIAVEMLRRGLV